MKRCCFDELGYKPTCSYKKVSRRCFLTITAPRLCGASNVGTRLPLKGRRRSGYDRATAFSLHC
jgi:hypothetical protein